MSETDFRIQPRLLLPAALRSFLPAVAFPQLIVSRSDPRAASRCQVPTPVYSPHQVWTAQPDGTLDYVNQRVIKYFNRSYEEMMGWNWKEVLHPEDLPRCVERWAEALQTGEPYEIEFRLRRGSDGAYLWHVGRALPVHDDKGRIIKWFGTNTDITSRKVIEENLVQLNQQKQLILESVGEGIYGLDLEGRTTFVNPAAAKMIGWNTKELLGQSQHAVLHHTRPDGTAYPPEECPIYAAFKDGEVHHVDHEVFWRKDGTSFPVEYVSTPIWEKGKLKGAVVTFLDITERWRSKALLEGEKETLEMITKGADLARILDRICQMVEDYSNGMFCSILILEGKRLRHGAAPSLPDSYNQKIDGTIIGPNAGSCGTAAFRKEPVFCFRYCEGPALGKGQGSCPIPWIGSLLVNTVLFIKRFCVGHLCVVLHPTAIRGSGIAGPCEAVGQSCGDCR